MHRRETEEIGLDREPIGIGHIGIAGIRHCRIKPFAFVVDTPVQGIQELRIAPVADAGFLVGRDVGRIDRAERKLERQTSGKWHAALRRVAGGAVGGARQIFAAPDQARLHEFSRNAGRICTVIIGERRRRCRQRTSWAPAR